MEKHNQRHSNHPSSHYKHLAIMALAHLPFMYIIMFVMVDKFSHIYNNLNTFYMAVMMVAPMVVLMPLMMKEMYPDKKKNLIVYAASLAILVLFYFFIRGQNLVGDKQFLRSMIPHHSGAILMCEEAKINDIEIKTLCANIIEGQKKEVEQMESILSRL
ncbi:MAG: DUF305 domain-containing protein [Bdellovibrionales bacterium]|nr:DUF305 domain-containing protein [Bdellovibrionales bacterium]